MNRLISSDRMKQMKPVQREPFLHHYHLSPLVFVSDIFEHPYGENTVRCSLEFPVSYRQISTGSSFTTSQGGFACCSETVTTTPVIA